MVLDDFDMEEDSLPDLKLSYLPTELINTSTCPPVIIANDRQLQNFVGFVQKCVSTRLCVTSKAKVENLNEPDFDLNKSPADSSTAEEEGNSVDRGNEPAPVFVERQCEKKKEEIRRVEVDEDAYDADTMISAKEDIHNMSKFSLLNVVKKGQLFENKTLMKATFEICAMKYNFHYEVIKTDRQLWYVRCEDNACNWCVRAECLKDSAYFIIKKYVGEHTCAPSSKTKTGKTASAKTIGSLIMHRYEGVKEGPKCNDIIQIMRMDHGSTTGWVFSADEKGARLLLLESSSTLEVFKRMVLEDFDMEEDSLPDLELSYPPTELINTSTCPPVIIANDRQLQNFVRFVQKCVSTRLCVTSKAKVENLSEPDFDLNKSPADSSTAEEEGNSVDRGNEPAHVFVERQCEKKKEKIRGVEVDEDAYDADTMISAKEDIHNMSKFSLLNVVKKGQLFENKTLLKATFEICAMKHNFHYEVIKTDRQLWYVRCEDNACNRCVRAECLKDSAYFIIKKYVGEHTCAYSGKTKAGKTA
ncbi:hypothetical protein F2Q70_00010398 [Brassica cretica]|uniref:Transposase MuDR plant domain-containing protein n=1 Tax=Brassica cretica TaxID=69181 RepID=A0A8S9M906_BRACR|nr:hypothetical protein F2Q70_00010398 [Brassica cretica]